LASTMFSNYVIKVDYISEVLTFYRHDAFEYKHRKNDIVIAYSHSLK
jgi:hypothetical protein